VSYEARPPHAGAALEFSASGACWEVSGTGGALRTTAAPSSRPASHRCMLGTSHADCSVAVNVRSACLVSGGGRTHGSPDTRRRRFQEQADAAPRSQVIQWAAHARVQQLNVAWPKHQHGRKQNRRPRRCTSGRLARL